ncbi:neprosin family prolyl endopeptidase [Sorangium sp. So ce327]|jgi:hypothetical protein|uniref:neprosin family prolyl endopeptidase n=1 Tax=Sorangium sp. So ce327 TaxID=3133301 RepID=UPI003F62FB24
MRRSEVDGWNAQRARGWNIVGTVQMPSGQIIEFVEYASLYPDAVNVIPPPQPQQTPTPSQDRRRGAEDKVSAEETAPMHNARRARTEYEELGIQAPEGTVPMPRPTFDGYVEGNHSAENLDSYIKNHIATPLPSYDGNKKLYANKQDLRTHVSNAADVSTWDYANVGSTEMSLMQGASLCSGASPSTTMEAVEVGFMEQSPLYSNSSIHLFLYFRTAGGAQGARIGGYDELQAGFKREPSATIFPGAVMSSSTMSVVNGTHYSCPVEIQLFQNRWWVHACGQWMGYYPTQNSVADAAGERITFDLIASGACRADWYGEYWHPGVNTGSPPTPWANGDVGSGQHGNSSGQAAWIYNPRIGITTPSNTFAFNGGNAPGGAFSGYDPDCYSLSNMLLDVNNITFFRLGGPGGDGSGCN